MYESQSCPGLDTQMRLLNEGCIIFKTLMTMLFVKISEEQSKSGVIHFQQHGGVLHQELFFQNA